MYEGLKVLPNIIEADFNHFPLLLTSEGEEGTWKQGVG